MKMSHNSYLPQGYRIIAVVALLLATTITLFSGQAFAQPNFLDIFDTPAQRGSWELLQSFNWTGRVMSMLLTSFAILCTVLLTFKICVNSAYLAFKQTFDYIDERQREVQGTGLGGIKGGWDKMVSGANSSGLNAVLDFVVILLPNIKNVSSYREGHRASNLGEDDTIITYHMKEAIPTIVTIFIVAMMFNGTMGKALAMFANVGLVGTEYLISTQLDKSLDRFLQSGEKYDFTIGAGGSPEARLAERIAKSLYAETIKRMDVTDAGTRLAIGNNVENYVWTEFMGSGNAYPALQEYVRKSGVLNTEGLMVQNATDVSAIRMDIVFNTNETPMNTKTAKSLSDFTAGMATPVGSDMYAHVTLRKNTDVRANYFAFNGGSPE